ncbi:MAG: DUF3810 domain-containing protein [Firmicutes bacterium]|nr:DUF3810 domain-containing protein [Bacillota bacterium]
MKLKHKKTLTLIIISGALLFLTLIVSLLKTNEFISEYIFTRGVSRGLVWFMGSLTDLVPFSVFELIIIVAIIMCAWLIVKWIRLAIKRKHFKIAKSITTVLLAVSVTVLAYSVTASPSYYREPAENYLPRHSEILNDEEVISFVKAYFESYNELALKVERNKDGSIKQPSHKELSAKMQKEYARLNDPKYKGYFSTRTARPKRLIFSGVLEASGSGGIAFLPTGEAHISRYLAPQDIPYVMAHEIAHTKGIMYESCAELVSAYVLFTSEDIFLRYSGYSNYLWDIYRLLSLNKLATAIFWDSMSETVRGDIDRRASYRSKHHGAFNELGNRLNDFYLKLSGASGGTLSYHDPVVTTPSTDIDGNPILDKDGNPVIKISQYNNIQGLLLHLLA